MTVANRITVQTLASDMLRVNFGRAVAVTPAMFVVSNYTITALTSGATPVTVERLIKGGVPTDMTVTYVDLEISRSDVDAIYRLEVSNLETVDHETLISQEGDFRGRITKADSVTRAIAALYDTDPTSTLRQVLTAMALEDERIGGQGDLSPLPLLP